MSNLLEFPHNEEAEQAVLSSLVMDNDLIPEAIDRLTPDHFYSDQHKTIFKAILELYKKTKIIDLVILTDALKGQVEPFYLAEIISSTPTSANFIHYAEILNAHHVRRLIRKKSYAFIDRAEKEKDYSEILSDATEDFSKMAQEQIKSDIIMPKDLAKTGIEDFGNRPIGN